MRAKTRLLSFFLVAALMISGCQSTLYEVDEKATVEEADNTDKNIETEETSEPIKEEPKPIIVEKLEDEEPEDVEVPRSKQLLDLMTTEEKVSQLFILDFYGMTSQYHVKSISDKLNQFLVDYPIGGVIFFAENIESYEQTETFIKNLQSASKIDMFISIDEEGGLVSRLGQADIGIPRLEKADTMAKEYTSEEVKTLATDLATKMSTLGFNYDFAPVFDINTNPSNTVISTRSFGHSAETVTEYAMSFSQGLNAGGIISSAKHFPGHGDTDKDSHLGMASITGTKEDIYARELQPFMKAVEENIPSIMIGHLTAPAIDPDFPASLSSIFIQDILRQEMGYRGLVITDSLRMQAITDFYEPSIIGVNYLMAGGDIILIPNDFKATYDGLLAAIESGDLSIERLDESVLRILETKLEYGIIE